MTTKRLEGKHVVFTGRLASMPRVDAIALVHAHGGACDRTVSRQTAILVVGQEGWPLRKDGRVCSKLVAARKKQALGHSIAIQTEDEWLSDLGLHEQSEGIHRRFTSPQLGRLLKLPRQRLAAWIRAGIVAPVETIDGVHFFDFQQVASLRSLWEMTQAGVSQQQLAQSLKRLARWLPNLSQSPLALLECDGEILVRLDQGLADASGQLQFDFPDDGEPPSIPNVGTDVNDLTYDECFRRGAEFEAAGDLTQAARAYREALFVGEATATAAFNLGNVLYAAGHIGRAAERFRQAVEIDHEFVEGWNNLGNALCDLGEPTEAIAAFRQALALSPNYADAHYNIAEALESVGENAAAREHWRSYIRIEPIGEWAAYARRRLR